MQIAILNNSFFDDSHLARLRQLGALAIYDDTGREQQAVARVKGVKIALVDGFKMPLNRAVFESGTKLKLVVLNSTAFHMVDLEAANRRGVKVANIPGYATQAVAEHAIALMFAVVRAIPIGNAAMRAEPFQIDGSNRGHERFLGFELRGKTLGVIGLGAIGSRIAELAQGLGMKVLAYNRSPRSMNHVELTTLDGLLSRSDIVSVNLALEPATEHIISDRELGLMKPSAVLINTADGKHVNTQALYRALKERRIFGAGLDGLAEWDRTNPLLSLENVVFSPQSASWTREACASLAELVVRTVEAFAHGRPINLVN
jgi:lactate dehydrogenase-like 2-hydroxyacid dehydrogenase